MPLHLLGKKSWNVYNPENIARVRRDEAEANALDRENERRGKDEAAERRLHVLRGEAVGDEHETGLSNDRTTKRSDGTSSRLTSRKRRRLAGEDDTDRDMRLARESVNFAADAPLFDSKGHISLVDKHSTSHQSDRPADDNTNTFAVHLKDAGGLKVGDRKPWYSTAADVGALQNSAPGRDVWGNEDSRRHERDRRRLDVNDPLAMMKKGIKRLRENEAERQEWKAQRERDLHEVESLARKHHRRKASDDEDSLEGFQLDNDIRKSDHGSSHRRKHRRHHHGSRHRTRKAAEEPKHASRHRSTERHRD